MNRNLAPGDDDMAVFQEEQFHKAVEIVSPFVCDVYLHAIEAFEADEIATKAFGSFYRDIYHGHKLREWERGFYPVHEEQRRSQLTFI